ncbi:hypothetical protein V5O48_008408, partial [Marasmius crinis-equi]
LQHLLFASCTTIEALHLDIYEFRPKIQDIVFSYHFPHLISLTVRERRWQCLIGQVFADFLSIHNTLTHLDLGERGRAFSFPREPANAVILHPDTLPRLSSFRGSLKSLEAMTKARLRCLWTTVVKVEVSPSIIYREGRETNRAEAHETLSVLGGLLAFEAFQRVEEFRLYLGIYEEDMEPFVRAVRSLFLRGSVKARRGIDETIVEARIESNLA